MEEVERDASEQDGEEEDYLDRDSFTELQNIPWTGLPETFALSPTMDLLAYIDSRIRLHVVRFISMEHVEPPVSLPTGWTKDNICTLGWSPDGHELFVGSTSGDVLVTDIQHLQDGILEYNYHPESKCSIRMRNNNTLEELFNCRTDSNTSKKDVVSMRWNPLSVPVKSLQPDPPCAAPNSLPPSGYAISDWLLGKEKYEWLADLLWNHSFSGNTKGCGTAAINCGAYMLSSADTSGTIHSTIGLQFPRNTIESKHRKCQSYFNVTTRGYYFGAREKSQFMLYQYRFPEDSTPLSKMQTIAIYEVQITEVITYIYSALDHLRGIWTKATKSITGAFEKLFNLLRDYGYAYAADLGENVSPTLKQQVVCQYISSVFLLGEAQNSGEGAWTQWIDASLGENGLQRLYRVLNDCYSSIEALFSRCISRAVQHLQLRINQHCSLCSTYPIASNDATSCLSSCLQQKMQFLPDCRNKTETVVSFIQSLRRSMLTTMTIYTLFARHLIWTSKMNVSGAENQKKANQYRLSQNERSALFTRVLECAKYQFSALATEYQNLSAPASTESQSANIFDLLGSGNSASKQDDQKYGTHENTQSAGVDVGLEPFEWDEKNSINFLLESTKEDRSAKKLLNSLCDSWSNVLNQATSGDQSMPSQFALPDAALSNTESCVCDIDESISGDVALISFCSAEGEQKLLYLQFPQTSDMEPSGSLVTLPVNANVASIKSLNSTDHNGSQTRFAVLLRNPSDDGEQVGENERILSLCVIDADFMTLRPIPLKEDVLQVDMLEESSLSECLIGSRAAGVVDVQDSVQLSGCGSRSTVAILVGSRRCIIYDISEDEENSSDNDDESDSDN